MLSDRVVRQKLRNAESETIQEVGAGSPEGLSGCLDSAGDTSNETKLTDAVWSVDRKRRMRNRTYGVVGGRRGQPRPLPDMELARKKRHVGFVGWGRGVLIMGWLRPVFAIRVSYKSKSALWPICARRS